MLAPFRVDHALFGSLTILLACGGASQPPDDPESLDRPDKGFAMSSAASPAAETSTRAGSRTTPRSNAEMAPELAPETAPEIAGPDDEDSLAVPVVVDDPEPGRLGVASRAARPATLPKWSGRGPFARVGWTPGPLKFEPSRTTDGELPHDPVKHLDAERGSPMAHMTKFGWSASSATFVHCADLAGDCASCITAQRSGEMDTRERCETQAEMKRWRDQGFATGPTQWQYGDLVLEWSQRRRDDETILLDVSVKVFDGPVPDGENRRVRFALDVEDPGEVMPEVVALSPDGQTLAIVAHGFAGEGSDEFAVQLISTGWLAAQAYNAAGLAQLESRDHDVAAALFLKAAVSDPVAWRGPFNAACAYAGAGDRRVQAALTEAVRRGGDAVKAKAKRDPDLHPVRRAAWFEYLVGL